MPNTTLTKDSLKKRIRRRLGEGIVAIELQDENLEEAIETTLDHYNQVRPKVMHSGLAVTPAQKEYNLATIGGFDDIAGVVNVNFLTRRGEPTVVDPFDPFGTSLSGVSLGYGSGETFGDIAQRLAYSEDAARTVDAEPEWEFWWNDDEEPVLFIRSPRAHIEAGVEWRKRYVFSDTGLQKIPHGDAKWFIDYATAQAKMILGRALRKFQGVTNPDGSQDPLDGVELVAEAQEEIRNLEELLEKRRPPLPPVIE